LLLGPGSRFRPGPQSQQQPLCCGRLKGLETNNSPWADVVLCCSCPETGLAAGYSKSSQVSLTIVCGFPCCASDSAVEAVLVLIRPGTDRHKLLVPGMPPFLRSFIRRASCRSIRNTATQGGAEQMRLHVGSAALHDWLSLGLNLGRASVCSELTSFCWADGYAQARSSRGCTARTAALIKQAQFVEIGGRLVPKQPEAVVSA
jgi:hypothetical protein